MAGYDLTGNTTVLTLENEAVASFQNPGPYTSIHVRAGLAVYVDIDKDPTSASFKLGSGSTVVFHVEVGETIKFLAAERIITGEPDEVRITALGSGEMSEAQGIPNVGRHQAILTSDPERELNVGVRYKASAVSTSTWALLVDLSDDETWPHTGTFNPVVSLLTVQVDKAANTVGSVLVGVITRIDGTNADVMVVSETSFLNASDRNILRTISFSPSVARLAVEEGNTPYYLGPKSLNVSALQSDQAIPSAAGTNVTPAVGDIVVQFAHTGGGAYEASVRMFYHTHEGV